MIYYCVRWCHNEIPKRRGNIGEDGRKRRVVTSTKTRSRWGSALVHTLLPPSNHHCYFFCFSVIRHFFIIMCTHKISSISYSVLPILLFPLELCNWSLQMMKVHGPSNHCHLSAMTCKKMLGKGILDKYWVAHEKCHNYAKYPIIRYMFDENLTDPFISWHTHVRNYSNSIVGRKQVSGDHFLKWTFVRWILQIKL